MTLLVTGGAGFIGSNFIFEWMANYQERVVILDKLTYAGNVKNLESVKESSNFSLVEGDICDEALLRSLFQEYKPRAIIHFAAESHVDRSIDGPGAFINTNVIGTFKLLEVAKDYWKELADELKSKFRFLHVSTDEVFGSLALQAPPFVETTTYSPNSPYSASKAASDHLVRAWHHTYGLPVLTTNCSNNYGPYQYPEKLIPLVIGNALDGKSIPIYGNGQQIRDWLHVTDHCKAVIQVLERGRIGEAYNIGGNNEWTNIDVVELICNILDDLRPLDKGHSYKSQITHVTDRPGHDQRYAIDATKIECELGWRPSETFETGLAKTITWYLSNSEWILDIKNKTKL